jgi:hypothetical protein
VSHARRNKGRETAKTHPTRTTPELETMPLLQAGSRFAGERGQAARTHEWTSRECETPGETPGETPKRRPLGGKRQPISSPGERSRGNPPVRLGRERTNRSNPGQTPMRSPPTARDDVHGATTRPLGPSTDIRTDGVSNGHSKVLFLVDPPCNSRNTPRRRGVFAKCPQQLRNWAVT